MGKPAASSEKTDDKKGKPPVGEKIEKTDKDKSGGGTTKKTTKKGDRLDDAAGGNKKAVSVLDEAAMENAYNICHNVQDLLYFRGFFWEGSGGKGKKGKGKKGKKKK